MKAKSPFYTRKKILIIAAVVIGMYIGIWSYVLIGNKISHIRQTNAVKSQQAKFKSLSKEEQASQRAQAFLVSKLSYIQPSERLFLDYLQRKFDLDPKLGVKGSPFVVSEDPRIYPQDINYLYRIAYPNKLVTVLPKEKFEGPALTNIFAVNCDHLPLPKDFWQTMESNYKAGGYYLTHDALALAFMKDNQCTVPATESDLGTRVTEGMIAIMNDKTSAPDLRYEALAFLQLSGHNDFIKAEWMAQVAAEQKADGSWGEKGSNDKSSYHATLLALWSLLEYNHPTTPYEPIIQRPAPQR